MTRSFMALTLACGLAAIPLGICSGCSHTLSHDSTTVRNPDGSVSHEDKTVTEKPNGDVVTQKDKVNN